jgi:hypothetical protein
MTKTSAAFGILAGLCLAACYNTKDVKNGGLVCAPDNACPEGFTCIKDGLPGQAGHCYRNGTGPTDASTSPADKPDATPDTLPPRPDVANPAACTVATPPFGPFAGCSVPSSLPGSASACDPVCQSGCACDRRCVVEEKTLGSFVCEAAPQAPSTFVPVLSDCSGERWSSCAPGSICVGDEVCPSLCYKACRGDEDCPRGSLCSLNTLLDLRGQPVSGLALCTPPAETCNPTGAASCATPRDNFNCVFQAGQTGVATDTTICDCRTLHDKKLGAACRPDPDDCEPGLVCVANVCRQICELAGTGATACSGISRCTSVFGSSKYGYCR